MPFYMLVFRGIQKTKKPPKQPKNGYLMRFFVARPEGFEPPAFRIRKTGGYIAGQAELSPEELMARALMVAQKTLAERDARISDLTVKNQIMAPKAEYFDELVDRHLNNGIRETAKELGVKEKAFVAFLLEGRYLYRDQKKKLQPYAQYADDLFVLKECYNEKTSWSGTQLLVTPKGR